MEGFTNGGGGSLTLSSGGNPTHSGPKSLALTGSVGTISIGNNICNGGSSNSQAGKTLSGWVYMSPNTGSVSLFTSSGGTPTLYPVSIPVQGVWTFVSVVTSGSSVDRFGIQVTGSFDMTGLFLDDFKWQ
jgi:hypothetical protein